MGKIIEVSFPGNKKVDAKIGEQIIKTDQSLLNGGDGSAPEPFQLFLTSIAACAGIYALNFCQTRNLSTDGLGLVMECDFDQEAKQYTKMKLQLKLPRDFPDKYRMGIQRAMDLCSVKRHIINSPEFEIGIQE